MEKSGLQTLMSTLRGEINSSGIGQRSDITQLTVSREEFSGAEYDLATKGHDDLTAIIDASIHAITSSSNEEYNTAQRDAAGKIAALALNPNIGFGSLTKLRSPVTQGETVTVGLEALGIDDVISDADVLRLSNEAYDGQATNNPLYFSVAFNLGAARQDAFGEAFFPTIVIDPMQSGIAVEAEYTSLMNEYARSKTGTPDALKAKRVPIIKAIYDNVLFGTDKTRLVPVFRDDSKPMLLEAEQYVDASTGTDVTTAPLLFGKQINLLGISQTDALLAKGVMDNTDSLDRSVSLEKVYFSLTGKDATDTDVTENFIIPVAMFPRNNFTYAPQGHNKDLDLAFRTESVIITTDKMKTSKGALSAILGQLPEGHTVKLGLRIHGEANTSTGDVGVYGSDISIIEIKDAAGNVLPATNASYISIANVFKTTTFVGYTLTAFVTNSNMRYRGTIVTSDRYTQIYPVPLRSGITVLSPVNNATGTDNDAAKVTSQIQAASLKTSVQAVQTLINYASMLYNVTNNGTNTDVEIVGVGQYFVNPFYAEEVIDLTQYVDSTASAERAEDIRAALRNKIKELVLRMWSESSYVVANQVMRQGAKVTVLVGTDPELEQWLTRGDADLDIGEQFIVKVVSTPNRLITGKMFITFIVEDEKRNTAPNPLNFGQCAWAPTISTDIVRSSGGATSRELYAAPRFLHIVNLPVLSVLSITDINSVLKKVVGLRHTVA